MRPAVALALVCVGCGPRAFVTAEVRSDLTIPEDTNALHVAVRNAGDDVGDEAVRAEERHALRDGQTFPLVLVLEMTSGTPHEIEIHVTAMWGEWAAAAGAVRSEWRDDLISEVVVELEPL